MGAKNRRIRKALNLNKNKKMKKMLEKLMAQMELKVVLYVFGLSLLSFILARLLFSSAFNIEDYKANYLRTVNINLEHTNNRISILETELNKRDIEKRYYENCLKVNEKEWVFVNCELYIENFIDITDNDER